MVHDAGDETDYDMPPASRPIPSTKRVYGRHKQPRRILPKQLTSSRSKSIGDPIQGAAEAGSAGEVRKDGQDGSELAQQKSRITPRSASAAELGKRARRESSGQVEIQDGSISDVRSSSGRYRTSSCDVDPSFLRISVTASEAQTGREPNQFNSTYR